MKFLIITSLIFLTSCSTNKYLCKSDNFHKTGFIQNNCFQFTVKSSKLKTNKKGIVHAREKNNNFLKLKKNNLLLKNIYNYYKTNNKHYLSLKKEDLNNFDLFKKEFNKDENQIIEVTTYYSERNNKVVVFRVKNSSLKEKLENIIIKKG